MKRRPKREVAPLHSAYQSLWERFLVETDPAKRAELRVEAAEVLRGIQVSPGGVR